MNTKTSKTAIVVASITALGTISTAIVSSRGNDKLQSVVAAEVARNDQRWQAVERLIEAHVQSDKDVTQLREAVAGLKASVDLLSRNRRSAAREAADIELPEPPPETTKAKAAADILLGAGVVADDKVQTTRVRLFD